MKKFLLFLFISFTSQMPVLAFENYIIFSPNEISEIICENEDIISVNPMITLSQGNSVVILKSKKEGATNFKIKTGESFTDFSVKVSKQETEISQAMGFSFVKIDSPPDFPNYDKPPLPPNKKKE